MRAVRHKTDCLPLIDSVLKISKPNFAMAPRQVKTAHTNKSNQVLSGPEPPIAPGRKLRGPQGERNAEDDNVPSAAKGKKRLGKRKRPLAEEVASSTNLKGSSSNRKGSPPKRKKSTAKEDAALSKGESHPPQAAEAIIELRNGLGELVPLLKRLDEQCSRLSGLLVSLVDH